MCVCVSPIFIYGIFSSMFYHYCAKNLYLLNRELFFPSQVKSGDFLGLLTVSHEKKYIQFYNGNLKQKSSKLEMTFQELPTTT